MVFIAQSCDLKAVAAAVSSVISGKNAMPILDNMLFSPDGDHIVVTGSDGDNSVYARLSIEEPVDLIPLLVPAKDFCDAVKHLGDMPATVDVDPKSFEMRISDFMGDFCFMCSGTVSEYPQRKSVANGTVFEAPADRLINSTALAMQYSGHDELRLIMNSVAYDMRSDGLRIVASDSKRLFADVLSDVVVAEPVTAVVSSALVKIVARLIKPSPDVRVKVSFDGKTVCFDTDGVTVMGRIVEGKYPRWEGVMPKNNSRHAVLNRKSLIAAINRVSGSADSATNAVRLEFDGSNSLKISARDIDFSKSSKVTMPTVSQTGFDGALVIGVKCSYLLGNLGSFASENVVLMMSDANRAILVKETSDGSRTTLVMPTQLQEY